MTTEKVKKLVDEYRDVIVTRIGLLGYPEKDETPKQLSDNARRASDFSPPERFAHYLFMCDQIVIFMESGEADKKEKAMRWLGFLQGILWREDYYTLGELKKQSRS